VTDSWLRTICDGDVAGESLPFGAIVVLELGRQLEALRASGLFGFRFDGRREDRAALKLSVAGWITAYRIINCLLEEAFVPAVDEVAMIAVTGWVAVGQDKFTVHPSKAMSVPNGLEHQSREATRREARWTVTSPLDTIPIGHVVFVIWRVISTVITRREDELETKAIRAVGVQEGLVGHVVTVQGILMVSQVVQTVEAKSHLAQGELTVGTPARHIFVGDMTGVVSQVAIAGDHLESRGEGLETRADQEVVRKHAAGLANNLNGSIRMLEVKRGSPVHRLILGDSAGGAIRSLEVIVGGVHPEVQASVDGVRMVRDGSWIDERVNTGESQRRVATHAPEAAGEDVGVDTRERGQNDGGANQRAHAGEGNHCC